MAMSSSARRTRPRIVITSPLFSSIVPVSNQVRLARPSVRHVPSPPVRLDGSQSMTWTPIQQTNVTPPSKRPRGRPRKAAITSPVIAQLAVKPPADSQPPPPPQQQQHTQPVPLSILSPPASVSSGSQNTLLHRNSTSPSTLHHATNNLRYMNDHILTPPVLPSTTDTNVIARVPSLFDQVKTTTNESTFAVLSGVQNVLLSPNRDANTNQHNSQRVRVESATSVATTTTTAANKQVPLATLIGLDVHTPSALGHPECQCSQAGLRSFACRGPKAVLDHGHFQSNRRYFTDGHDQSKSTGDDKSSCPHVNGANSAIERDQHEDRRVRRHEISQQQSRA